MRRKITRQLLNGLLLAGALALYQLATGKEVEVGDKLLATSGAVGMVLVTVFAQWRERRRRANETLAPSLTRGAFGGLGGGALGGVLVAVVYLREARHGASPRELAAAGWSLAAQIFVFAALAGALLGLAVQAGMWALLNTGQKVLRALQEAGAVLGGAAGGALGGAVAAAWFAPKPLPFLDPWLLAAAGLIGAMAIALATILYEYDGRIQLVRTMVALFVVVSALSGGVMALFYWLAPGVIESIGMTLFLGDGVRQVAAAGAKWGALAGALVGLQVGLTLLLARVLRLAAT